MKPLCKVAGLASGLLGKACGALEHGVAAGKKLVTGHPGDALKALLGDAGGATGAKASAAIGLAAVVAWVLGGAKFALHETSTVLGATTTPQLRTTWFSSTYWRVAGIAAVLTLPFLFAAAVQALIRSELALLLRAAFGYLPLAMLTVSIAAPLTMLLLTASDQLSRVVSSAAGNASVHFLKTAGVAIGGLSLLSKSPFLVFLVGIFTVAGALFLWVELLVREAAVYVIVLMLPLVFAALVWPARRIWAVRAVELLVALIISKFAIVAVLSLGGAALGHSTTITHVSIAGFLAGLVLVVMAAFAPWAMLRLLPLAELASGAAGSLRDHAWVPLRPTLRITREGAEVGDHWASTTTAQMRRQHDDALEASSRPPLERDAMDGTVRALGIQGGRENVTHGTAAPPSGSSSQADEQAVGERLPSMPPRWQAPDWSWNPLVLGLRDGSPPRPWPPGREHGDQDDGAAPVESHDPRPPAQDPEDGRL